MSDYDQAIEKIKEQNRPIIAGFEAHLKTEGLSKKTVKSHVDNIDFFSEYLTYYEPLESLYETDVCAVSDFLGDFFPRKAMWACPTNVKSYITTFKKFLKWMAELNYLPENELEQLSELIKEEKEEWIASVSFEDEFY